MSLRYYKLLMKKKLLKCVKNNFHYQKIILALFETDRIMKEIDKIGI